MKADYNKMIDIINQNISDFNKYLNPDYYIPLVDIEKIIDDSFFTCLTDKTWQELRFPNAEKKGVYFIFGYNSQNPTETSLYIGKASFTSTIGRRLASHLGKDRNSENYTMYDLAGNIHNLEYILSLDLESKGLDIFASSLEEFLIKSSKRDIHLLNGTGNYD